MRKPGSTRPPPRPLPDGFRLKWGRDTVIIFDRKWVEAIAAELEDGQPEPSYVSAERYSARDERISREIDAALGAGNGYYSEGAKGITKPTQPLIATKALNSLLNIELPAALNFRYYTRSEARLTALQVRFEPGYGRDNLLSELRLAVQGYQLYASGHLGGALYRPKACDDCSEIEVRRLNGTWQSVSFDGPFTVPENSYEFYRDRTFEVAEGGYLNLNGVLLRMVTL